MATAKIGFDLPKLPFSPTADLSLGGSVSPQKNRTCSRPNIRVGVFGSATGARVMVVHKFHVRVAPMASRTKIKLRKYKLYTNSEKAWFSRTELFRVPNTPKHPNHPKVRENQAIQNPFLTPGILKIDTLYTSWSII